MICCSLAHAFSPPKDSQRPLHRGLLKIRIAILEETGSDWDQGRYLAQQRALGEEDNSLTSRYSEPFTLAVSHR
jgi:hypothetical protein